MGNRDHIDPDMDVFFDRDHDLPYEGNVAIYWQKCMCAFYGDTERMKQKFKVQSCTVANSLSAVALTTMKGGVRIEIGILSDSWNLILGNKWLAYIDTYIGS